MSPKGPPSSFFYFAKECLFKNYQRPPFYIFRHYATYRRKKIEKKFRKKIRIFFQFFPHAGTVEENTSHIEVLLLFLSLRYGADLGRSRLVKMCSGFFKVPRKEPCVLGKPLSRTENIKKAKLAKNFQLKCSQCQKNLKGDTLRSSNVLPYLKT